MLSENKRQTKKQNRYKPKVRIIYLKTMRVKIEVEKLKKLCVIDIFTINIVDKPILVRIVIVYD